MKKAQSATLNIKPSISTEGESLSPRLQADRAASTSSIHVTSPAIVHPNEAPLISKKPSQRYYNISSFSLSFIFSVFKNGIFLFIKIENWRTKLHPNQFWCQTPHRERIIQN